MEQLNPAKATLRRIGEHYRDQDESGGGDLLDGRNEVRMNTRLEKLVIFIHNINILRSPIFIY